MNYIICLSLLIGLASHTYADLSMTTRIDSHGPIGVMGDHNHAKKEVMTSYRFMNMSMNGNIQGKSDINTNEITTNYNMAPEKMTMAMHMMGIMIGLTDKTTLMAMTSYQEKQMESKMNTNMTKESTTKGFSDIKITALQRLLKQKNQAWLGTIGISLPLGSIDKSDSSEKRFPYPMQLGSGTTDILIGTTYTRYFNKFSLGTQLSNTIRTGKNKHGYRLGQTLLITSWIAKPILPNISLSARISRYSQTDIDGKDSTLMPEMSPTTSTNVGQTTYLAGIGSNILFNKNLLKGARLAAEVTLPIARSVNGIQMKELLRYTLGYQQLF